MARHAVVTTAKQWQEHPGRCREYGSEPNDLGYIEAREWVLKIVSERRLDPIEYPAGMDSYGSLYWVFKNFEELAAYCTQTIRTIGPALIESGALVRAIVEMENCIHLEKSV